MRGGRVARWPGPAGVHRRWLGSALIGALPVESRIAAAGKFHFAHVDELAEFAHQAIQVALQLGFELVERPAHGKRARSWRDR